jgi:long-chain acyl-CoA synthetase
VLDVARRDPDGLAVDDGLRTRSWSELVDRSFRLANLIRDDFGVRPGGHLAHIMTNRVECIELALAASFADVWLTPVNWHLTADEVSYVLADSGAPLVFADAGHRELAGDGTARAIEVGDELDALIGSVRDEPPDLDSVAGGIMHYTSGTTGYPKGVKRARQETLGKSLETNHATGTALGLNGEGPHLVTGPLYHAAPLGFALIDLHNGAPLILMERFDEEDTLDLIEQRDVAHTHLVPTMCVRLLRVPEERRASFDPSSLRLVLHGAAPISETVKRQMIEWWGQVLVEYWGASEGGVVTLIRAHEWLEHPGSVGRATSTHEVFAADDEGRRLPPGETGTLWCRNKTLDEVFEYHEDAAKTANAFLAPGTYTIGDIGQVDDDGYVWLSDRKSHMIISGGVNVYPAEVERVMQDHPAVADVAVFGIPDEEWGESVKAAVELVDGIQPSPELEKGILAFARDRVAGFKVPRTIDFHEELPRYDSGKILTRRLKDKYWSEAAG